MDEIAYTNRVERWGVQEIVCKGKEDGNPFVDYSIKAEFKSKNETTIVDGFYDGDGVYKVRFMPSFVENYIFRVMGNFTENTEELQGEFTVTQPQENNHGPVRVAQQFHFAYEDGTPYFSIGTTCYVWHLQSDTLQKKTLETLKDSAFNKIRFCIFPKHYDYNFKEPRSYPYIGTPCDSSVLTKENFMEYYGNPPGNDWNFEQFNVEYFQHMENCIIKLCDLGIQADLIVMHPYDRWGFSMMSKEQDDLYWKYVIARFAAFRNVWWSLANEYDLMPQKTIEDWERYANIICTKDPYNHLRSIHNCHVFYDLQRPWITHLSIQRIEVYRSAELTSEWRERYKKPVVLDEIVYEGNIQHGWGNISGKELVRRFWEASCRGGYAGHGETYMNPEDILWWSHGGELHGESPARFKFLYDIMKEIPGSGLRQYDRIWDEVCGIVDDSNAVNKSVYDYYLMYYGFNRPTFREFNFDNSIQFKVEIIDTWDMTINEVGVFSGRFKIEMPGKEYMAIRMIRVV